MIAIIGGGISGLVLGHYLAEAGLEHVILEASEVPGGVMRTLRVAGTALDLGPQRTRLVGELGSLVEELGLAPELLVAPPGLPLWVYRQGRLRKVPLTVMGALSTDLLSWRGKLSMLREPFTAGPGGDESVADFFTRKFGSEAYRAFLGPLYGGLYASDPARMKARHGLAITLRELGVEGSLLLAALGRGLRAREEIPTVSFREGLGALPEALARRAGERLRLGTPVLALEARGAGHLVHLGGRAEGEVIEARRVVLSLPAPQASALLAASAPEAAARIGRLRLNRLAVVHLRATCELWGYGYQVAFGEALETRGVTWNASIFGRDGVHTAYLGGMKNPPLVDWEDERLAELAASEFRQATGCSAEPLLVSRTWIPAWDESWDALSGLELPEGVHACVNWSARPGIPGRVAQARRLAHHLAEV